MDLVVLPSLISSSVTLLRGVWACEAPGNKSGSREESKSAGLSERWSKERVIAEVPTFLHASVSVSLHGTLLQ
jgi:hypothetical protein